jgi:hypothetical protein
MASTPPGEQLAERKKAAEFGANALILGHRLDQPQPAGQKAVAIFIPADSARAAGMCQPPHAR